MSKSQHVLKIKKDGTTYTCDMYTTPAEARNNLYQGKYVSFEKDGQDLYVPLTQTLNSATESTPILVNKKNDPNKYCIAQKSYYKTTVTAVANAVLTVKAYDGNNVLLDTWSSGAKWFPYGTKITASVVGNPSNTWNTPSLRINSGGNTNNVMTVNNIDITADAPTRKSYSFTLTPGSNQVVTLKYTQPGSSQVSVDVSGSARTFTVLAGTTWTASITSVTTGYNAGSLNKTSGTITDGTTAITGTNATIKTFTLKLNGTTGQTVTLKYTEPGASQVTKTSTSSAQSWTVKYGTTWTVTVAAATGYNPGTLSPASSGTVTADTTISITAASLKTYTLKLNATSNETITLKYKNRNAANTGFDAEVTKTSTGADQSFTVRHGTTWTASVAAASSVWIAGTLSPGSSGTVTAATTVSATAATLKTYTLKLSATTNETITLKYKNRNAANTGFEAEVTKTSTNSDQSITVRHGTTWTASVSPATGYTAGTLSPGSSGTVTATTTVSASAATFNTYTLKLGAATHQTITLKYKNRNSTNTGYETEVTKTSTGFEQSFTVRYGTTWTASNSPATGWNAGTLSGTSGTVTANTTVSVSAATHKTFNLVLAGTSNQTITLKYNNYDGTSYAGEVTRTSTGSNQTFTVGYGTTWTASVSASTGWNAGALSGTSGTVTGNTTVSVAEATHKTFNLVLAGTSNQTITLKYNNYNGSYYEGEVTRTSTGSNQTFSVGYGTPWTASISASSGYDAGTLSGTSGTVTGNVTVSATEATRSPLLITFVNNVSNFKFTVTYTNTSGQRVTATTSNWTSSTPNPTSVTIKYGTTLYFTHRDGRQVAIKDGSTQVAVISSSWRFYETPAITTAKTYTFVSA